MARKAELIRAYKARHGEGPFWYAVGNVLYWVDIDAGRVCVYDPAADANRTVDVHEPCGTVVPRLASVTVDREECKGAEPSDHAPVIAEIA